MLGNQGSLLVSESVDLPDPLLGPTFAGLLLSKLMRGVSEEGSTLTALVLFPWLAEHYPSRVEVQSSIRLLQYRLIL